MKKILSLMLAAMMLVSATPVAYAWSSCQICSSQTFGCPDCNKNGTYCETCDICASCGYTANDSNGENSTIPEVGKTTVTLVGTEENKGSYYEVEVPANMAPGGSADIVVEGNWKSDEILKVTAPDKVTLYYGNQSMDISVFFSGINKAGDDVEDCSATATLTIENASVRFGTWTGVIEYNVELVRNNAGGEETPSPKPDATMISFTVNGKQYQAEEGSTWGEFVTLHSDEFSFNESGLVTRNGPPLLGDGAIPLRSDTTIIANMNYTDDPGAFT